MHRRLSLVLVWRMHLAFLIWQELSFYQQLSEILNQSLMVLSPEAYYHCMIVILLPLLTAFWLLRFPLTNTNVIINFWYILSGYLWTLSCLVIKNLQSLSRPHWFTPSSAATMRSWKYQIRHLLKYWKRTQLQTPSPLMYPLYVCDNVEDYGWPLNTIKFKY